MDRSLIFTTDIPSPDRLRTLTPQLNAILGHGNWIIDLEDHERRIIVACHEGTSAQSLSQRLRDVGIAAEFVTDLPSYC